MEANDRQINMSVLTDDARIENQDDSAAKLDFKMVTFSLAGKDYGMDIMKIDGIAKAGDFTYVPNTLPFVLGVYNLRGEIISIIDLRRMLNLEVGIRQRGDIEDVLILRLNNDQMLGVVVDSIDRVIGIESARVQAPHPLLQDINIKYISGVVENEGNLYIILDVDTIFGKEEQFAQESVTAGAKSDVSTADKARKQEDTNVEFEFVVETLATFGNFYVTELNRPWVAKRLEDWKNLRNEQKLNFQLTDKDDSDSYLQPFYSPYTGTLWSEDYKQNFISILSKDIKGAINIWNPGTASGHEAYSIVCAVKQRYDNNIVKVWANDSDLLSISNGPNLVISSGNIPREYLEAGLLRDGPNGYQFAKEIKDLILFEYHDILHGNRYPEMDIIVARDTLSFLQPADQERILKEFRAKLKEGGILLLGQNEVITEEGWFALEQGNVLAYRKENA